MKEEYKDLYVKAETDGQAFERFINVVKVLRKECPWDKEQSHKSLIGCMTEEAYEVVEAINNGDIANLKEELGDVLLQVVFHGIIGEEDKNFDIVGIINQECDKMISRHPHVFLEENVKTLDKALERWENMKCKEHGLDTYTNRLKDVPKSFPALMRSYKVQKRAADVGFQWEDVEGAIDKLDEELDEFKDAYQDNDKSGIIEELGDLLFSVVNVCRFLGVDPEQALNGTSNKFINRFSHIEDTAVKSGQDLKDMSLEEMDKLWNEAKKFW